MAFLVNLEELVERDHSFREVKRMRQVSTGLRSGLRGDLLHKMRKDAATPPAKLRRKKYFSVSYLVVDEVGFEAMDASEAALFFRLISDRYGRASTAITTKKSVKEWPGVSTHPPINHHQAYSSGA